MLKIQLATYVMIEPKANYYYNIIKKINPKALSWINKNGHLHMTKAKCEVT